MTLSKTNKAHVIKSHYKFFITVEVGDPLTTTIEKRNNITVTSHYPSWMHFSGVGEGKGWTD